MSVVSCFCDKITEQKGGMHWSIVIVEQPFPPLHTHKSVLFLLTASCCSPFITLDIIPCSLSGHKVEIHDVLRSHNQKTQSASHSHWTELAMLFLGVGDIFETHCEDWAFVLIS